MRILHYFIIIFFIPLKVLSQGQDTYKIRLTYDMQLFLNGYNAYHAELVFNNHNAIFNYKNKEINEELQENNLGTFSVQVIDTSTLFIKTNLIKNELSELVRSIKQKKYLLIREDIPKINWKIHSDSTKLIDSYRCIMAKGRFAGRDYTVWFTPELPALFGPWKLHGLPGTILQASDSLNEVIFICTGIESIETPLEVDSDKNRYQTITKEEYRREMMDFMDNLGKNISSKMGRGVSVQVEVVKYKTIEIYEN